ncbi:hypothetical protein U2F10_02785 [Leptothoe sp. EHU-05/26/07-4]
MSLIATEDYTNKRIYLSVESIGVEIEPIDIYTEHRERRHLNLNGERLFLPMVSAFGNEQIGANKFTPRFTNLASGVKLVPYDVAHSLLIRGTLISTVDALEGRDLFDRSGLSSIVDIDYQPLQVEIITIPTGGALTTQQASQLSNLAATLESIGVFSIASLANAPSGSGGGSATIANQTAILAAIANLPTLAEMESSGPLTTIPDLGGVNTALATIQTALESVAADAKAAKNYSAAGL